MSEELIEKISAVTRGFYNIGIIFVVVSFLVMGFYNHYKLKTIQSNREKKKFFFGKDASNNPFIKQSKAAGIKECVLGYLGRIFWFVPLAFLFVWVAPEIKLIWEGTGKYLENYPSEILAALSTVLIIISLIEFRKQTWLIYDVTYILKKQKIIKNIRIILLVVIMAYLAQIICPVLYNIYGYRAYICARLFSMYNFVIFLILFISNVWRILNVLFDNNIDCMIFDNLHELFGIENFRAREVHLDAIELDNIMEYLLEKYCEAAEAVKFDSMITLRYDTNLKPGSERYISLRKSSAFIIPLFIVIVTAMMILCIFENQVDIPWCEIIVGVVVEYLVFMFLGMYNDGFGCLFVSLCYGWVSYEFVYEPVDKKGKKKNKKSKKTDESITKIGGHVALFGNKKRCQYVYAFKNILALYWIALQQEEVAMKEKIMSDMLKRMTEDKETPGLHSLLIAMDYLGNYYELQVPNEKIEVTRGEKMTNIAQAFSLDVTKSILGDELDNEKYENYVKAKNTKK